MRFLPPKTHTTHTKRPPLQSGGLLVVSGPPAPCPGLFGASGPVPRAFRGLRPRTPAYFSLAGKVGKRAHKGGTLSMGSLPYGSLPHDDTKGGASPPFGIPRIT